MNGSDPKGTAYPGAHPPGGYAPGTGFSGFSPESGGPGQGGTNYPPMRQPVTAPGGTGDLQQGVVLGKYQIVRRLGAGGMGSVYEAVHTHIGKSVALKTMNPALTSDPRAEARFMREAAAASRLGHPNVVDVTDYGSDQGVVYIVMEILRGDDLSTLVQHAPAGLEASFVADVMLAVCAGVFAAHEKGVVHRDLKPQNIFLARTPLGDVVPKVLDFGISKLLDEGVGSGLTNSGSVMGTTHYLSPEQVTGLAVDGRSDEFALGVILFECLTGQRPHQGDTIFTIMRAISEGRFQRPRVLRPDMLPALEAVILRAMAARPDDRYPTVHAMGNGLLPFATPRGQVMWGDYFSRPPATAMGTTHQGPANPTYAPAPPPGATMVMGQRAFASDTRSGSGVGPVSVIGTQEFEQQRGQRPSRFRGLFFGTLVGAAAAAIAIMTLRPGLPLAPIDSPVGTGQPTPITAGPRSTSSPTARPTAMPESPGTSFGSGAAHAPLDPPPERPRVNPALAAPPRAAPRLAPAGGNDRVTRSDSLPARAKSSGTARTQNPPRDYGISKRPPAVKPAPTFRRVPTRLDDDDLILGPRSPGGPGKAPILD